MLLATRRRTTRLTMICLGLLACGEATLPEPREEHEPSQARPDAAVAPSHAVDGGARPRLDASSLEPTTDHGEAGVMAEDAALAVPAPPPYAVHVPPTPQTPGDPERGYRYLVNGDYQTLGAPWAGFKATMSPLQPRDSIPGREGDNALTSYMFNVLTDPDGVKVAAPNCIACHATHLNGKLIIGLGRPDHMIQLQSSGMSLDVPGILLFSPPEQGPVGVKFATRLLNALQYGVMDVFPELASHHDPETLKWSDAPLFDADTGLLGWVDIPPWWRAKKKNGLYYTGVGRGEKGRHMSFMSVFSVRDTEEARVIEENFVDVAAFIQSLEAPAFPGEIDRALAAQGERVFLDGCATCHGTYGADWTYPNVVIPYQQVGTDPSLATDNWVNAGTVEWFGKSYYAGDGQAWMEQLPGYYAPPLDGIWATAPFFHNGSVPTLDGVIDPKKRPAAWTSAFGDGDYDLERVGWRDTPGQVDVALNLGVFDTSQPGNSNAGHTYGASLPATEQRALLEYLKTL
jgi:hypothetical protein